MNILTFDIEEWFHILDHDSTKSEKNWSNYEYRIEENMDRIFDLLDKKRKHSGNKMKSGLEFKLSCKNFFDFLKFSSKFEPTVI